MMSWQKSIFSIVLVAGLSWGTASQAEILVVAPHPDDDVIIASGIISAAVNRGEKVTVVYITNGDALDGVPSGTTRQNEAVTAQVNELGLLETDLIFLGYPDAYLQDLLDIYTQATDQLVTSNGISQTYASRGLGGVDYHNYQFGAPGAYNLANLLQDLESIFTTYRPDHIYTLAEFDTHSDHSSTYSFVASALNTVVSADPTYKPMIHKSIVHTGYPSIWPAAQDPTTTLIEPPNSTTLPVLWTDREAVDVPVLMQSTDLVNNPKYRAIDSHASQGGAGGFIGQFVHKDEIFWIESVNTVGNQPPQANAGLSQAVNEADVVLIDGTASSDPDGDLLSYAWTQTGGTAVALSDATATSPIFTAPSGLVESETLTFELVVSDGAILSAADVVSVFVIARISNIADQATVTASSEAAGQPATAAVDGIIDGWPNNGAAEWSSNGEGAGAWLNLAWNGTYTIDRVVLYDRPNLTDQATSIELRFSDGSIVYVGALDNAGGLTEVTFTPVVADSMQIVVTTVLAGTANVGLAEVEVFGAYDGANRTPLANAGVDQSVNEATLVALDGSGSSDADGDLLTYAWTQTAGSIVVLSDITAVSPSFTSPSAGAETLTFELVVNDGTLSSVADVVNITVSTALAGTTNVSSLTTVTASSESAGQPATAAVDGIIDGWPSNGAAEWSSNGEGAGAWLNLAWNGTYTIDRVVLYDRPNLTDQATSIELRFSDGTIVYAGALDNAGGATEVSFAPVVADSMQIVVTSVLAGTVNVGLAEVETYGLYNGANRAPLANAGLDQTVNEGTLVVLDGSGSSDADSDPLTYAWTQTAGSIVVLSNVTAVSPSFTSPSAGTETLSFELVVNDGALSSVADVVNITVSTALAGTTNVSNLTTVTASSESAGQPATAAVDGIIDGWPSNGAAEWSSNGEGTGAWLNLAWSGTYTIDRVVLYDRPNLTDQATSIELRFSDGSIVYVGALDNAGGATEVSFAPVVADSMQIVVTSVLAGTVNVGLAEVEAFGIYNGANRAPLANAGLDQTVNEGTLVALDGSGSSDADSDPLTYAWTQTAGSIVVLSDVSAVSPSFTSPSAGTETLTFELVVNDGALSSVADVVNITVSTALAGTTNVSNLTTVTASSEAAGQPATAAVDGIIDGWPSNGAAEWSSNGEGTGAWLNLAWSGTYTIDRVVLYDRPNLTDQATSIELRFSDGSIVYMGALDNAGGATEVSFAPVVADSMQIVVTSVLAGTVNVGLAEVETYGIYDGANRAPLANAGIDQTVNEATLVALDGSGSSDADSDPLTYVWTQTAGSIVVLSDVSAVSPSFTSPSAGTETLTFELVVNDGALSSVADVVNITVSTALAGTTNVSNLTTVSASSEAAGQPATAAVDGIIDGWPSNGAAEWSSNGEGTGAWLNLAWNGTYTIDRVVLYDRPNLTDQATSIELRFSDGSIVYMGALDNAGGATEVSFAPVVADSMQIVVTTVLAGTVNVGLAEVETYGIYNGANRAPLANAGIDQIVNEGTLVALDGSGSSDADSDPLTYAWTQTAGSIVVLSDVTAVSPSFTSPAGLIAPEVLSFDLVVNDGTLSSVVDTVNISVLIPAKLPSDVVHYYRLDETSGTSFTDEANTAAASCTNCPTPATGFVGGAQQFDGSANQLNVVANVGLDWAIDQSFSVEFWMQSGSCVGQQAVVGRADSNSNLHWWAGCENGNAAFYLVDTTGAGLGSELFGSSNVADGSWHHIVAIRDAYANTNHIFVDGVEEASASVSYSAGFDSLTAGLNIGWLNDSNSSYSFAGGIDEVAVFSRALSTATINRHYNDGQIGLKRGYWSCGSDINVLPLGDSITAGDLSVGIGGYRGPLLSSLSTAGYGVNFVGGFVDAFSQHEGWGGYSPSAIASITPNAVITGAPEVVLLHVGTNEEAGFPDTINVEAILDAIYAYNPNITVVLARIINRATYNSLATQFNLNLQTMADARIAAGDRIVVVDMESALDYANDMGDLLHPNNSGYTKMSTVWMNGLRSFIPTCQQVAPLVSSTPVVDATIGNVYVYDVDGTGFPYSSFSLTTAPVGMTINPDTGRISWTPSVSETVNVTVQVSNSLGSDTQSFSVTARLPGYANVAALATISASTEDVPAAQEAIKAVDGVVDGYPGDASREWATLGEGVGAWIQLDWASPYVVDRIVFYDRPNTTDQITGATLYFSDGTSLVVGALDNAGGATELSFTAKSISSIRMSVDNVSVDNVNVGLAEIEVFGSPQ